MSKTGPAPTPAPPAWVDLLDDYLAHLAAAGYPATTRNTRAAHVRKMARGLGAPPENVTGASLVKFFADQEHWARETRRGYRNTGVSFFGWAHREGRIPADPSADLPSIKPASPAPRPAPDRVYRAALMAADARVMLMLRLAAEVGLRRAEVAQVSTTDLAEAIDGYQLVVHGKGGKVRTLPVSDELGDMIALGAAGHTGGAPATGWLFPGDDAGHLSPRWVGKLCAAVMPAGWTLHKLRHRFATRAYRGTRNLRAVQTMLGHASVATTEIYTAVDDAEVRAAMMAAAEPTSSGRIAGAIGAIAASFVLVAASMTNGAIAAAIVDMLTPQESLFFAELSAYPLFELTDRTPAEIVGFQRQACRLHDAAEAELPGSGEPAALNYLAANPRVRLNGVFGRSIAKRTICTESGDDVLLSA